MSTYNKIIGALIALVSIVSCQKDPAINGNKAEVGSPVNFSLQSFETKTHYNATDVWKIEWDADDIITIYCYVDEDGKKNFSSAQYKVVGEFYDDSEGRSTGKLSPVDENDQLTWQGVGEHRFYAVYGDGVMTADKEGIVTFPWNEQQEFTATEVRSKGYCVDMSYAYMVSYKASTPVDNIKMIFRPIMTTIEFKVKGSKDGGPIRFEKLEVNRNTGSRMVSGSSFRYNINASAAETVVSNATETAVIKLDPPVVINNAADAVNVTVILPPYAVDNDNNKLDVSAYYAGRPSLVTLGSQKAYLPGGGITPSSKVKIELPSYQHKGKSDTDYGQWQKYLPDDAYVSMVSMPGTNSSVVQTDNSHLQPLPISEQFNTGVRTFMLRPGQFNGGICEFGFDTVLVMNPNSSDSPLLSNQHNPSHHYYWINAGADASCDANANLRKTFETLLNNGNSTEFIILVVYQGPIDSSNTIFKGILQDWRNAGLLIDWAPDLKVRDARGHIIMLVIDDSNNPAYDNASGYIKGWPAPNSEEIKDLFIGGRNATVGNSNFRVQNFINIGENKPENIYGKKIRLIEKMYTASAGDSNPSVWYMNNIAGFLQNDNGTGLHQQVAEKAIPAFENLLRGKDRDGKDSNIPCGRTGMVFIDFVGTDNNADQYRGKALVHAIIDHNDRYVLKCANR